MKIALTKNQKEFLEFVSMNEKNKHVLFLENILRHEAYEEIDKDRLNRIRDKYKIFWNVYKLNDGDIIHSTVTKNKDEWVGIFDKKRTLSENENKHILDKHVFRICFDKVYCVGQSYFGQYNPFISGHRFQDIRKATLDEIREFNMVVEKNEKK